ncbi:hypothetical protein L1987_83578 [Smallanthus sonchifolius]|uniref:Uncharacterized protein n=1 Tax=Smallanthus sonchifolius TaxID=185202 RepID=A0ACB8YCI5_9ASTR|nr:hypothetical protein L1987_83578 [Smallanthus sonchifolius]
MDATNANPALVEPPSTAITSPPHTHDLELDMAYDTFEPSSPLRYFSPFSPIYEVEDRDIALEVPTQGHGEDSKHTHMELKNAIHTLESEICGVKETLTNIAKEKTRDHHEFRAQLTQLSSIAPPAPSFPRDDDKKGEKLMLKGGILLNKPTRPNANDEDEPVNRGNIRLSPNEILIQKHIVQQLQDDNKKKEQNKNEYEDEKKLRAIIANLEEKAAKEIDELDPKLNLTLLVVPISFALQAISLDKPTSSNDLPSTKLIPNISYSKRRKLVLPNEDGDDASSPANSAKYEKSKVGTSKRDDLQIELYNGNLDKLIGAENSERNNFQIGLLKG